MNYTYMVFVLSLVGVLVGGSIAVATDNADGLYTDKTDGLFEGNPLPIDDSSPDE